MAASTGSITLDADINTSDYVTGAEKIKSTNKQLTSSSESVSDSSDAMGKSGGRGSKAWSAGMGAIAGVAASVANKVMNSFGDLTGEIISASDSTDKFKSTLNFAGIDGGQIDKLTASSKKYADQTVYGLSDIQNVTAQLASNGVEGFDSLAEAAGNLNAVAGGNADTFKSVGMVLTQTAGQGKLTTENWNQLADAIPGASGKLQEAMKKNGAYTGNFRDAMSKGEITAKEFNTAISDLGMTDAAKEAATSTKTIEGAFGNLQATVVTIGTDMLNGIKPALTGFMSDLSTGLSNGATLLQDSFSSMLPSLQETFGPAADTLKSSFSTAFDTLKRNAEGMGDSIGNAFQSVLKLIKPVVDFISNNFGDAIEAVSAAAPPLLKGISDAFGAIQTVLQPIIDKIGEVLTKVNDAVWTTFKDILTGIGDALSSASDWITKNKDGVTALVVAIGTIVAAYGLWTAAVKAYNLIMTIWKAATTAATAVQAAFNLVMNANPIMLVITLIAALVAGLIYFFTQTDTGREMWQSFTDWLKDTWNNISKFFSDLWANITGFFEDAGTNVKNAWNKVGEFFRDLWAKITGFFKDAGTNIKNAWNNVVNWFKELPGRILGAFKNIGKKIGDAFGDAKHWIGDKFRGAGNWLKNVGGDMIRGLWNGIQNVGGWLRDKISGFFGGVVDNIKNFFGIGSPSRLMRDEIGKWIPAGVEVGIEDGKTDMRDKLTRTLEETIQPVIGANGLASVMTQKGMKDFQPVVIPMTTVDTPRVNTMLNGRPSSNVNIEVNNPDVTGTVREVVNQLGFYTGV